MIPKWFCPGIVALGALTISEFAIWMDWERVNIISLWVFGLFGLLCIWLMYQEWKDDKRREWEKR